MNSAERYYTAFALVLASAVMCLSILEAISVRRRWVLKPTVLLFGVVAAGSALYGLLQDYKPGETLIAAAILGAFVVGVAAVARVTDARLKRR